MVHIDVVFEAHFGVCIDGCSIGCSRCRGVPLIVVFVLAIVGGCLLGLWAENLVGLVQLRGLDWVFGYCCGACLVKNVCVLRLCV